MADSALSTQVKSTPPDNKATWGELEAAVEVLKTAIAGVTLGASDAAANAGSTASKAIFVQGGASGLAVATKVALGDNAVEGTTSGAAVVTDANGTIQQYLRGLVKLWIAGPAAGEAHIGEVSTPADVISVTPVCDTSAYASGDTLFDTTAIPNAVRVSGGQAILQNLIVVDGDDNTAAAMTVFVFGTATSLTFGTANAAPSISDANAAKLLGIISIASGDWVDLGGCKVANIRGLGIMCESSNVRELGFAAMTGGSPTQTASGLVFRFGFLW